MKAFPTAYGCGAAVTGGRGGSVIHVTNLNSSGSGSFDAALRTSGPAYIVFDVSGVIEMPVLGKTYSNVSNKTILGQTAPRGGITVTGGKFRFDNAVNVIIRYIRSRPRINKNGDLSSADDAHTSAFLFYGADGVILDHVSASFSHDKAINFYKNDGTAPIVRKVTVSKSLIADSNTMMNLGNNPQADYTNCQDFSVIYNLFGNSRHRTPNMEALGYGEIINNVVHGWGARLSNVYCGLYLNHIGNYYKNPGLSAVDNKHQQVGLAELPSIYTANNFYTNRLTGANGENNRVIWSYFQNTTQLPSYFFSNVMHDRTMLYPCPILTPIEAYNAIIEDVGANAYLDDNGYVKTYIDPYDQSVINNVISNTRVTPLNVSNWVIPSVPSGTRPVGFYGSNAHIAQNWFAAKVPTGQDHNDIAPSGYPWIEEYANQVDGATVNAPVIVLNGPSVVNLTVGDTYVELGATASDIEDGNITGSIVVTGTVNTAVAGTYYKYYNVVDSGGIEAEQVIRIINVFTGPPPDPTPTSIRGVHKTVFYTL